MHADWLISGLEKVILPSLVFIAQTSLLCHSVCTKNLRQYFPIQTSHSVNKSLILSKTMGSITLFKPVMINILTDLYIDDNCVYFMLVKHKTHLYVVLSSESEHLSCCVYFRVE